MIMTNKPVVVLILKAKTFMSKMDSKLRKINLRTLGPWPSSRPVSLYCCLFVHRKSLRPVKSCWSTTCSSEKPPLNRPGAAAATSPPSRLHSTALCRCSAADTPPPQSATAVPPPSPVTASLCCEPWPLTRPSGRSWCCRGSSGSCSSTTWDEALLRWERRSVSSSAYSPGKHLHLSDDFYSVQGSQEGFVFKV